MLSIVSMFEAVPCKIVNSPSFLHSRHLNPHHFTVFGEGIISPNFLIRKCNRTDLSLDFVFKRHHLQHVK